MFFSSAKREASHDALVSVEARLRDGWPRNHDSFSGQEMFLWVREFRLALGNKMSPMSWIQEEVAADIERSWREAHHFCSPSVGLYQPIL